jgi:quinol monooxygenase YgiN
MFAVHVTLRVKPGRADEFRAGLESTVAALEAHAGTALFLATQSQSDPHEFRFTELYRDEAAFREHLALSDSLGRMRKRMEDLLEGSWQPTFAQSVAGGSKLAPFA